MGEINNKGNLSDKDKEDIINLYCKNEMSKLKSVCYPILKKFGGISYMEYDDFYSQAQISLIDAVNTFNEEISPGVKMKFNTWLVHVITMDFETIITNKNRQKRMPSYYEKDEITGEYNLVKAPPLSIDFQERGSELEMVEAIDSGFDIHEESFPDELPEYCKKYMDSLSNRQKKIITYLMDGYKKKEIIKLLGIDSKEYMKCFNGLIEYEKIKILQHI